MMPARRVWPLALTMALVVATAFMIDQPFARLMAGNDPHVVAASHFITQFGQGGYILYPAGIIVIITLALKRLQPDRRSVLNRIAIRAAFIFASVAAAGLAVDVLKVAFGRARPPVWLAGDHSGFEFLRYGWKFNSFPSGHTTTSFAAAIAFSALFPQWRGPFFGFAFLIAESRLALDDHYPSDVAAGAALGITIAIVMRETAQHRGWLPRTRELPLANADQENNSTHSA
jgi:undecaprenyl-diphosphatase